MVRASRANVFVDEIYDTFIHQKRMLASRRSILKVLLLDLYIAWLNDPELNIAVHMTPSAYSDGTVFNKGKSRYNELNIKVSTIEIVHRLHEADLIGFQKDLKEVLSGKDIYLVYGLLINLQNCLRDAAFGEFDIGYMTTERPSFFVIRKG